MRVRPIRREDTVSLNKTSRSQDIRILRRGDVELITGLGRSTIYRLVKAGKFPKPVQLVDEYTVGWLYDEVQAWLAARVRERDKGELPRRPPGKPRKGVAIEGLEQK